MNLLKQTHSGQVALVMVLIMTVVSAVAVSMASRSTVETRTQELATENVEAMLTAQSGLEVAVAQGGDVTGDLAPGKSYTVSMVDDGATGVISDRVSPGETLEINLSGAVGLTGIRLYWKPDNSSGDPAFFVSDIQDTKIVDYAFAATNANNFTAVNKASGALNGVVFDYVTDLGAIPLTANSRFVRVTTLGDVAYLGVQPIGTVFPVQTKIYKSIGNVGSDEERIRYGIEYKESATNQLPLVFDYALFAKGSIVQ